MPPASPTKLPNQSSGSNSSCLWPDSESPNSPPAQHHHHPSTGVYFTGPARVPTTTVCYNISYPQFNSLGIYGTPTGGDECLSPTLRELTSTQSDSPPQTMEVLEPPEAAREAVQGPDIAHPGAWTALPSGTVWPYRFAEDYSSGVDAFRLGCGEVEGEGGYQTTLLEAPRPNYSLFLYQQQHR
ncbi:unnamed protein product, partial [Dibothriocephalus latus]